MFIIKDFIEKNNLAVENDLLCEQMQKKIEESELVGFQSRGMVAGMVNASLQAVGMNTIFPNGIYVSCYHEAPCSDVTLHLIPKAVMIGLECSGSLDVAEFKHALEEIFRQRNLFLESAGAIATISEMAQLPELEKTADLFHLPVQSYDARELLDVEGMFSIGEPQDVCFGVDKICERAAVLASENGELIFRRKEYHTFALALAVKNYIVSF